ncbi:MAG: thioredoxin [Chitinophagales bacterium]|nr:thioredoxin [Chitinophagales bacterium]
MAVELTDNNFKTTVLDSNQVAVVDFWAEWCGPCKAIGPMIEEISKEYAGKAVVGKVDVDNNPETAMKYGIRNIPTILFIKNGQVVDKQVGAVPKANLVAMLNKHLS